MMLHFAHNKSPKNTTDGSLTLKQVPEAMVNRLKLSQMKSS